MAMFFRKKSVKAPSFEYIQQKLNHSPDLICREISIDDQIIQLIFMNPIVNEDTVQRVIIPFFNKLSREQINISYIQTHIPIKDIKPVNENVIELLLSGFLYVYLKKTNEGLLLEISDGKERSLEKAETESLVLGPKIAFTESLNTNLNMIRKLIRDERLITEELTIGTRSKRKVRIVYLKDIADEDNVETVKQRLQDIHVEDVMDSSVLAQMIDDNSLSIFPQYLLTQLPDRFVYSICSGRIGIIVDQSPTAIICPSTFLSFFESTEDIYMRWFLSSSLRMMRFIGMVISVFFTPIYVAAVTFHNEVIPSNLLITLGQSRVVVPFPPLLEALLLEVMIDLLREAGARLPSKVGQTMGIVGGIVLGQATVEAGLTSNILIIVVSLSALANFTSPTYEMGTALRILRFPFLIAAGFWGFNGIMLCFIFLLTHLLKLTSLGRPYLSPLYPFRKDDLKYFLFRLPIPFYYKRAISNRPSDRYRWSKMNRTWDVDEE
jgi:spore germination protein